MTNPYAPHRVAIRKGCDGIRRLLYFVHPVGAIAILQEVGDIECAALAASDEKLPTIKESLERLIWRLKKIETGDGKTLITPERWKQLFDEK